MESNFKNTLFDSLINNDLNNLNDAQYETEIFNYLDSINSSKHFNSLKQYSDRLSDLKSKHFFFKVSQLYEILFINNSN